MLTSFLKHNPKSETVTIPTKSAGFKQLKSNTNFNLPEGIDRLLDTKAADLISHKPAVTLYNFKALQKASTLVSNRLNRMRNPMTFLLRKTNQQPVYLISETERELKLLIKNPKASKTEIENLEKTLVYLKQIKPYATAIRKMLIRPAEILQTKQDMLNNMLQKMLNHKTFQQQRILEKSVMTDEKRISLELSGERQKQI